MNKNGFISLPIILLGVFSVVVVGVLGYFGYKNINKQTYHQPNPTSPQPSAPQTSNGTSPSPNNSSVSLEGSDFPNVTVKPVNTAFARQSINIASDLSQNFSTSEIQNISDMEKTYGFKFTADELKKLEQNKFVIKNLLDTKLVWDESSKQYILNTSSREFIDLYQKIVGNADYKERSQANSIFISSDLLMHVFSLLSTELLKETENKYLYGAMLSMSSKLYADASSRLTNAKSDSERSEWTKVRNYFAVPYSILSTAIRPITASDLMSSGSPSSAEAAQSEFNSKDKDADSQDKVVAFIKNLNVGSANETAIVRDIGNIYDASGSSAPAIFDKEFSDFAIKTKIQFSVPYSVFKPRGTYTSTSLRRQYFRAVQWYQQVPFFLGSRDLTNYALDIGDLLNHNDGVVKGYGSFSSIITFLIGKGDDLEVTDYAKAIADLGADKARDPKILADYFAKLKPAARIKGMPAVYPTSGQFTVEEVLQATQGMRLISQKFIPDSYWTGQLTQGAEKPAVNGVSLPSMASSLEIMSILGSPYARNHLTDLDFYAKSKSAIDTRLSDLKAEADALGDRYWQESMYGTSLWTLAGLFDWQTKNHPSLPEFMRAPLWDAKSLLTSSGFWTELRHTAILYAKQSFAELGAGGSDSCDERKVPPPPKSYIEPQAEAYDRLFYLANRLKAEYSSRGFDLKNLWRLENYIDSLNLVREYTKLELQNTAITEPIITKTRHSYDDNRDCVEYFISPNSEVKREAGWIAESRWEELRKGIVGRLGSSLPDPVEGPILPIKDKRVAVVADIHTGTNQETGVAEVLEEGTGVPRVIFVAVKDVNGPRLTIGFTYSQYEFITQGNRLTDEEWQKSFYLDSGNDFQIEYKPKSEWPDINKWYIDLLGTK